LVFPKAGNGRNRPNWLRFSGIGIEFAAAVAGFTLAGYWVDRHFGSSPKGLLVGVGLGLLGGGYNMIRASLAAVKEAEKDRKARSDRESDKP
jgi:F0F1-type ATP synthase assembly protein I